MKLTAVPPVGLQWFIGFVTLRAVDTTLMIHQEHLSDHQQNLVWSSENIFCLLGIQQAEITTTWYPEDQKLKIWVPKKAIIVKLAILWSPQNTSQICGLTTTQQAIYQSDMYGTNSLYRFF